ncbi:MAG: DNA cytosine methyltransferase [Methylococcales symbiont of Hymedesmia sp. n. MRB-2018]|nr:MAG: DNA cytosine methyltransferase [Methylococcales symbiont of Hymedesmia sp. n. MRB-2018]
MKAISLFSGAGGLDVGFQKAGVDIVWANDFDKNACETYKVNIGNHIHCGDINDLKSKLYDVAEDIDLIFGGPPCQGFSVAGKMDPHDPRSKHIWTFAEIVKKCQPKAFVMENVKALGKLKKWEPLRNELLETFRNAGYIVDFIILNSSEFNVPQARERVFFIGFKGNSKIVPDLMKMMEPYKIESQTVREALSPLDKAGTGNNKGTAKAKITITPNPIMRKSPYAGMLFNGLGRPVKIDGFCATLPATMGGNKTPIIDEEALYNGKENWVEGYHKIIRDGGDPLPYQEAPKRLRRLTLQEATIIQSFPKNYEFAGSQSSIFKQIGNAVPCNLGYAVASMLLNALNNEEIETLVRQPVQLRLVG